MSDISQWSTTAASNNSASPDGAPEAMAPSGVNDTMRENMAAIAKLFKDFGGNGEIVSGGTANAQTLTTTQTHAALDDMPLTVFRAGATNTGSTTLAVDGLTAKAINYRGAALSGGEIVTGSIYMVVWNATNDVYELVSSASDVSSGIDDNATGEILQLSDSTASWGDASAGETWVHAMRTTTDGNMRISGGSTGNLGGAIWLYGEGHANANDIQLLGSGTLQLLYDDSGSLFDFQANAITTTGTLGAGTTTITSGDLRLPTAGSQLTVGGAEVDNVQAYVTGAWTSGGASTLSATFGTAGVLTGHADDTTGLFGSFLSTDIVNMNATTATDIAQVRIDEPTITNTGGGAITNASTLLVTGAPTEGSSNYAILVDSGDVRVASGDLTVSSGFINVGSPSELTVATGAVTATQTHHTIDTEADAATDDLNTINGGTAGDILILQSVTAARDTTLKHETGNLHLAGGADFVLSETLDKIVLINRGGTDWDEISRSTN